MVQIASPGTEVVVKKKAYHHGDLRNAIIIEATARARAQGEKAIILREIAGQIGVSATAAYRHFTNRQQLVEEVAARGFAALAEAAQVPPVAGADSDPRLAAYVDLRNACLAVVRFSSAEPAWALMMIENLGGSAAAADAAQPVRAHLQARVDRGIEAGTFRPGSTIDGNRIFWAGIDGLSTHAMFGIYPEDREESDRATCAIIDMCTSPMLSDAGLAARDAVELPDTSIESLDLLR